MYGHDPDDLKFRFQRVSPIHVSPHNPNVVYHASQYLHKTVNDGLSWETISPDLTAHEANKQIVSGSPITRDITGEEFYSTIYDVKESSVKEGLIWVGANDGPVHVTRDGGKTWTNVTPKELLPGGRIDCVEPSPIREGKAYFTSLRYQLGDWKPYIFKTTDYGQHWTLLTDGLNGIPADYPVRVVREDPDHEGLLYAGTEYGLFVSLDDGITWKSFMQNLPVTPVTDLQVFRKDLLVSTMGRSFWILDNLTPLHQLADAKMKSAFLYKPVDTYRYRYIPTGKNDVPNYPTSSVIIDYHLKVKPAGDIKLEILSEGKVIRSFTSALPPKDTTKAGRNMATNFPNRVQRAELEKGIGGHRFRWDMTHEGPWDKDPGRSKKGGNMVSPGEYAVRLTVDQQVLTQNFKLLPDPRVARTVSIGDMKAQEVLALEVRGMEDSCKRIANKIQIKRKSLSALIKENKATTAQVALDKQLADIESILVTSEGPYQKPGLIDQLNYLRSLQDQADQRPGRDSMDRLIELRVITNRVWEEYGKVSREF